MCLCVFQLELELDRSRWQHAHSILWPAVRWLCPCNTQHYVVSCEPMLQLFHVGIPTPYSSSYKCPGHCMVESQSMPQACKPRGFKHEHRSQSPPKTSTQSGDVHANYKHRLRANQPKAYLCTAFTKISQTCGSRLATPSAASNLKPNMKGVLMHAETQCMDLSRPSWNCGESHGQHANCTCCVNSLETA